MLPRTLFEAIKVAGFATYKQSRTEIVLSIRASLIVQLVQS